MGFGITIEKIKDKDALHYYLVSTNDFGGCICYILIDADHQQVTFFNTNLFDIPIDQASLHDPGYFKNISGIDKSISNLVIIQAYKAIKKNSFPQHLGVFY
jgi:hypothetical protein